jgi:hypothetical protein
MAVVALTVFVVSYLLIATERVNKVKAALTCSTPMRPASTGTSFSCCSA